MDIITRITSWARGRLPRPSHGVQRDAAEEQARYIRRTRELERQIDDVGRDAVFARARAIGWRDECPPLWVWECIVAEMLAERQPSQRTAEVPH